MPPTVCARVVRPQISGEWHWQRGARRGGGADVLDGRATTVCDDTERLAPRGGLVGKRLGGNGRYRHLDLATTTGR